MICTTIEVRDSMTFIPALAIQLGPDGEEDRYLLARAGYGILPHEQRRYVILMRLADCEAHYDSMGWGNRTMKEAHDYVRSNFDSLSSGAVVDVEFVLGLREEPKVSERLGNP